MKRLPIAICALLTTLSAQHPTADATIHDRVAITRNTGLQHDGPDALRGAGPDYGVRFHADGMHFDAALDKAAPTTQFLKLRAVSAMRDTHAVAELPATTTPHMLDRTAIYQHASGVKERFACTLDGVELSWVFDQRPAGTGDLVVSYAIETNLPTPTTNDAGELEFFDPQIGGIKVGTVTGIDAVGNRVNGSLQVVDNHIEMSLPAAFVDAAAYPLVLDPLIGTKFSIWGGSYSDADPDCAHDPAETNYLVTFLRTFSALDVRARTQRVDWTGQLLGGVSWLSSGTVATRPRVASFPLMNLYGVVWTEAVGSSVYAFFSTVSAIDGSVTGPSTVGVALLNGIRDIDIGGEAGSIGSQHAFVAVWHESASGSIKARRIAITAQQTAALQPTYTIFGGTGFSLYSEPSIARATPAAGKLMVVAQRWSLSSNSTSLRAVLVSSRNNGVSTNTVLASSSTDEITTPDVDGYGSEWVVAWRQNPQGSANHLVRTRSVQLVNGALAAQPVATTGSSFVKASYPSVGYSLGKTWLCFHRLWFSLQTLRVEGVHNTTTQTCGDMFEDGITGSERRMTVATRPYGDIALCVWEKGNDIWAQRLSNNSSSGTSVDLGGGCGNGGMQSSNDPSIGSSQFYSSVQQLSPTALLSVFNFAQNGTPLTCGPCAWVPFSVTLVLPVVLPDNPSVGFPIPCAPGLVGVAFETQWTTFDPAATPCGLAPGFSISNRLLHTIGQ